MKTSFEKIGKVEFPEFQGIIINMMPFIIGDNKSIPEEYRHYSYMIDKCVVPKKELGKTGYISITETLVEPNMSQRRGGIHTEKHPNKSWGGDGGGGWGGRTGLFMASNVDKSCMVWNKHIEVPGEMGDCEHLRESLGQGIVLDSGDLVWMTDGCPHESLPFGGGKRQWFRFVTSEVSVWYKKHSTENRLGVKPNCKIINGNKFN